VLFGILLGIGLWTVSHSLVPAKPRDLSRRLAPYLLDVSQGARDLQRETRDDPIVVFGYLLSPSVKRLTQKIDNLLGGGATRAALLARSGQALSVEELGARRVMSGALGLATGALAGALLSVSSLQQGLLGTGAGGVVGFMTGVWWVDYRLGRDVVLRDERIMEEFPTIIELLGLALAAGDSLSRALARVSRRSAGELGKEWARVMEAVDLGAPLGSSLRDSAGRIGGARVVAFVEHLAQALDRGAPLGEVVSAHARDAKEHYTRALVDKAGKAEVQMLVPMVLLILPITVIFAVYPGIQALQFGF